VRREAFARHVRSAMESLYDFVRLQTHPLLGLLDVSGTSAQTAGESLRQILWESVDQLRPQCSKRGPASDSLGYSILVLHYLEARDMAETCRELGIGAATFYRRKREGLDAVASILWEKCQESGVAPTPKAEGHDDISPDDRACAEAVQFARSSSLKKVDPARLLTDVWRRVEHLASEQLVPLQINRVADLPVVYGDPEVYQQILLNILTEGIGSAGPQGLELSASHQDCTVQWKLSGFRADCTPRSMKLMTGVRVSEALVQVYGGLLELSYAKGDLVLTCGVPSERPRTVLIVDDDLDTRDLYRRYLEGQRVFVEVSQGDDLSPDRLAGLRPDIVLLDVLMPHEGGWHVLETLRSLPETREKPVVVCSVLSQPRLALSLGASLVLRKPISRERLLAVVSSLLDLPNSAHQAHL